MSVRTALRANAAFSGLSGVALVVASGPIASLLGVEARWVLVVLGVGLVSYTVQLLVTARRDPVDPGEVKVAIGADLAWVAGSAALVTWGPLTPVGEGLVVAVAVVVLAFAILQANGIRRSDRSAGRPKGASAVAVLLAAGALVSASPTIAQDGEVLGPMPPVEALRVLPTTSEPEVDRLLAALERAYADEDVEAFVSFFTEDFEQVDVNRRVRIRGREAWRKQTDRVNAVHREMGRVHHGRARASDDWIVVEIEWSGTIRGSALGAPGEDRSYRYSGLGLLQIDGDRIRRQILYGDFRTLWEHLGDVVVR